MDSPKWLKCNMNPAGREKVRGSQTKFQSLKDREQIIKYRNNDIFKY